MMVDRPSLRDGPVEWRVVICRLLLIHLAQTWGRDADRGADGAKLEVGADPAQLGKNIGGHSHHPDVSSEVS